MSQVMLMRDEQRSVRELVHAALTEPEELAWNAVCVLHRRGTRDVFQAASRLCRSEIARERRLGADILGQLGVDQRTCPSESIGVLCGMLHREADAEVLQAILTALSHHDAPESIPLVTPFAAHSDPWVRHSVVLALMGYEDDLAIDRLASLTHDTDAAVRDWATFALGTQLDIDTPAIRKALRDRLHDTDFDTRGEALIGLARRGDHHIVAALLRDLASSDVGPLAVEASELLGAPELYVSLVSLRGEGWGTDVELLERAIAACAPRGVGDSTRAI